MLIRMPRDSRHLVTAALVNCTPRARALRRVAENSTLAQQEFNRAFVLMQYFGYLRRNPNDPQDTDYSGYDFWLNKLNQFNGNFAAPRWSKPSSRPASIVNASARSKSEDS